MCSVAEKMPHLRPADAARAAQCACGPPTLLLRASETRPSGDRKAAAGASLQANIPTTNRMPPVRCTIIPLSKVAPLALNSLVLSLKCKMTLKNSMDEILQRKKNMVGRHRREEFIVASQMRTRTVLRVLLGATVLALASDASTAGVQRYEGDSSTRGGEGAVGGTEIEELLASHSALHRAAVSHAQHKKEQQSLSDGRPIHLPVIPKSPPVCSAPVSSLKPVGRA